MCVPDWRHTVGYKGQSQLHFSHDQASPRSRSLFSYLPKIGQVHTGHSAGLIHYMRSQHALWRVRLRIQNSRAKKEKNSGRKKSSSSDCLFFQTFHLGVLQSSLLDFLNISVHWFNTVNVVTGKWYLPIFYSIFVLHPTKKKCTHRKNNTSKG